MNRCRWPRWRWGPGTLAAGIRTPRYPGPASCPAAARHVSWGVGGLKVGLKGPKLELELGGESSGRLEG